MSLFSNLQLTTLVVQVPSSTGRQCVDQLDGVVRKGNRFYFSRYRAVVRSGNDVNRC